MLLYHGSKVIVESPEIRIQRYNKDFYFGFYCTLFPEQAVAFTVRCFQSRLSAGLPGLTVLAI